MLLGVDRLATKLSVSQDGQFLNASGVYPEHKSEKSLSGKHSP